MAAEPQVAPVITQPAAQPAAEPAGLTDAQAQAQIEEMFKRRRGDDRRGDNGRYEKRADETPQEGAAQPTEGAQDSEPQDGAATPAKADSELQEGTEPADDPYGAGAEAASLPEEMEFEHAGKKYVVPKPLVDGALRQADYTRNMQEVAAEKQLLRAERANIAARSAIVQELAPAIAQVQNTAQLVESIRASLPDPKVDPIGYIERDKQARDLEATLQQLRAAVAQRGTELAAQQQSAQAELLREGYRAIAQRIPKWNESSFRGEVAAHATSEGFSQEELAGMTDPRIIKLMIDAHLFRKIRDAKADVLKKVTDAGPVVRPTGQGNQAASERAKAEEAKNRARKTGSTKDAEAAVLALLRANRGR